MFPFFFFFLSCLESQEAPASKRYPDVQTARLCQSPRVRAKVKIRLQSTSSSIRMTNASQRCHNMHWCNEFWGAGRRTVRGGAAEEGFIGKPASYFSTIYHTTFILWVCLFLQLQRWKVTQLQHELSQPRKRKAAFSAPQGIYYAYLLTFFDVWRSKLQGRNVAISYLNPNLPCWNGLNVFSQGAVLGAGVDLSGNAYIFQHK